MATKNPVDSPSIDSKDNSAGKLEKPGAEEALVAASITPCANFDGYCPDKMCYERLMGSGSQNDFITCYYCGRVFQQHQLCYMRKITPITFKTDYETWYRRICRLPARSNPLWTKIGGYSAHYCYAISELFQTAYLSHKMKMGDFPGSNNSHNNRTLMELQKFFELIDKGYLAKWNFAVEEDMLLVPGFGIDMTGSNKHLHETLILVRRMNNDETLIVPLATTIKRWSLLCAASRALIGREILWSLLWEMMGDVCVTYGDKIRRLMTDTDYANMVNDHKIDQISYPMVMGHVFILANVLRRPIVLLDTFFYESQSTDVKKYCPKYGGLFLPTLVGDSCQNPPIVLAWTGEMYDSIVPLVRIKSARRPILNQMLTPIIWYTDDLSAKKFINFDPDDNFSVLDGVPFYIETTTNLLKHLEEYNVQKYPTASAMLFSDYMENFNDMVDPTSPEDVDLHLEIFRSQSTFLRCLICWRLNLHVDLKDLERGGSIYCALAVKYKAKFVNDESYTLPNLGCFKYRKRDDKFEFVVERRACDLCKFAGQLRRQDSNGFITYKNGDHSRTPSLYAKCARRMKHVYYGLEYDNGPTVLNLKLKLPNGQLIDGRVDFFRHEVADMMNSFVGPTTKAFILQNNLPHESGTQKLIETEIYKCLQNLPPTDYECHDPIWTFADSTKKCFDPKKTFDSAKDLGNAILQRNLPNADQNIEIGTKLLLFVSFNGALCANATFECPYSVATYDELVDLLKKACPFVNWQIISIETCFLGTTYETRLITKEDEPFYFTELSNSLTVHLSTKYKPISVFINPKIFFQLLIVLRTKYDNLGDRVAFEQLWLANMERFVPNLSFQFGRILFQKEKYADPAFSSTPTTDVIHFRMAPIFGPEKILCYSTTSATDNAKSLQFSCKNSDHVGVKIWNWNDLLGIHLFLTTTLS